jgi:hypothetical protein
MPTKDNPKHPAQYFRAHVGGDPRTERTRQAMVGDGGQQDAKDDGGRFFEPGCQQEGEQLRLVADFGERDDAGRYQDGLEEHGWNL